MPEVQYSSYEEGIMPPAPGRARSRRFHNKTRDGCNTCKGRRCKCDERKPVCLRCMLAGRECKYDVPKANIFTATVETQQSSPSMALSAAHEPREERALAFFRERTAPMLTGFTSYTEIFWAHLIPQLVQDEDAVRHIVVAIATRHESLLFPDSDHDDLAAFSVKHHSLGLRALTESAPAEEILLVSCVAFIAFERLQDVTGLEGRYLEFVASALKMLQERRERTLIPSTPEDTVNLIDNLIEPMMVQIELLFSMFRPPDEVVGCTSHQAQQISPLTIPTRFNNLQHARDMFFRVCLRRYTLCLAGSTWSSSSTSFAEIHTLLSAWHQSLQVYTTSINSEDTEEIARAHALREQACAMVGAMLYSVREETCESHYCRPVRVDLSTESKVLIFVRLRAGQRVNLSGINRGRPPGLKATGLQLWPHARRLIGYGGHDFVTLELTGCEFGA